MMTFPENQSDSNNRFSIITWLVERGYVRDSQQANSLLVGIAFVCIVLSIFLIVRGISGSGKSRIHREIGLPTVQAPQQ